MGKKARTINEQIRGRERELYSMYSITLADGGTMIDVKKMPIDLMDDIYSLAYWMTSSEKSASDLLNRVYLNVDIESSEKEVIKMFRNCYFDSIGVELISGFTNNLYRPENNFTQSFLRWFEDIKLSVLLSEISCLKHRDISEITGESLETIRMWLSWGRKQVGNGNLFNYCPLSKAVGF